MGNDFLTGYFIESNLTGWASGDLLQNPMHVVFFFFFFVVLFYENGDSFDY